MKRVAMHTYLKDRVLFFALKFVRTEEAETALDLSGGKTLFRCL